MKLFSALILFIVLSLTPVFRVNAQTAESLWLQADTTAFKTGETVTVMLVGTSVTPIQGFTAQIRYDADCLQPVNSTSPIPGMNGLAVPQVSGLVDMSYASTTPQVVNGILAEIRFQALKGCQTSLTAESAALVIRNEAGFAVPLPGVSISGNNIVINIDQAVGVAQAPQTISETALSLEPAKKTSPNLNLFGWMIGLTVISFVGVSGVILFLWFSRSKTTSKPVTSSSTAVVHFKHGHHAGKSFRLQKLPILIGSDPMSDLCLNDPQVLEQHAKIYTVNNNFYLIDLGGETFVNGHAVRKNSAVLQVGDVVRLGKSTIFVFGI